MAVGYMPFCYTYFPLFDAINTLPDLTNARKPDCHVYVTSR
jgi:hypothetical protein